MFTYAVETIFVMAAVNAALAAYELALSSVPRHRVHQLKEKGRLGAASANFMKERMAESLSLIQLCATLAVVAAAAAGGVWLDQNFPWGPGAALRLGLFALGLSFVTVIFGEFLPKLLAAENRERLLLWFSPFFRAAYLVLSPLLLALDCATRGLMSAANALLPGNQHFHTLAKRTELRLAAAQARDESLVGCIEEQVVNAATALSLYKVEELSIPVGAMSYLPAEMSLQDALLRAHLDLHTRFPVTRRDNLPREVIGYVNYKDIINARKMQAPAANVAAITRPIDKILRGTSAPAALEEMLAKNIHLAVVISPWGGVLGLLTLEDIIGKLLGPLKNDYDHLPSYLYRAGGGFIAGGGAAMAQVMRKLELEPERGDLTLASWLEKQLGRHPRCSEVFKSPSLEIIVRKTRKRRLAEAFIQGAAR